jgi:hypothetical protein
MNETTQVYCFHPASEAHQPPEAIFKAVYSAIDELQASGKKVQATGFHQPTFDAASLQVILSVTAPPEWHAKLNDVMKSRGIRCAPFHEAHD